MGATEKSVYCKDAETKRDIKLKNVKPLYFEGVDEDTNDEEEEDEEDKEDEEDSKDTTEEDTAEEDTTKEDEEAQQARALARSLVTDLKLRKPFSDKTAFSFDKRL
jgi:ABC-type Zn2+ transport system substrate-binding protein/surface adhesin